MPFSTNAPEATEREKTSTEKRRPLLPTSQSPSYHILVAGLLLPASLVAVLLHGRLSAYRLAQLSKLAYDPSSSSSVISGSANCNWSSIWKLAVPGKVKHLVWRACRGFLPTGQNLTDKGLLVDGSCVFCGSASESTIHALLSCPRSAAIWFASLLGWRTIEVGSMTLIDWVQTVLQVGDEWVHEFMAMLLWAIWKGRNLQVMQGKETTPIDIIQMAFTLHRDFKGAQQQQISSVMAPLQCCWCPPSSDMVKINVDAAIGAEWGGISAVVCDSRGHPMKILSCAIKGSFQPVLLELLAIRFAVQKATSFSYTNIWVETDSLLAKQAITTEHFDNSIAGQVAGDICAMSNVFRSFVITHVRRKGNVAAHLVAKKAMLIHDDTVWSLEDLPDLGPILKNDVPDLQL